MGIWDFLYSAKEKLKENTPNLTPVTDAYRNSYRISSVVASNIYKAVTIDGTEKLKEHLPNSQALEVIKRIGTDVAVPELLRYTGIPGLIQSYRIYREVHLSSIVHDYKKSEYHLKELEKLQNQYDELREEVENVRRDSKIELENLQKKYEELFQEVQNIRHDNSIPGEDFKRSD